MLLISKVKPLYASDITHATSLSWYFADGFAGICWYVVLSQLTLLAVQSRWKYLHGWVLERLLFLYTAWLLASSILIIRMNRTGMKINTFVSSHQANEGHRGACIYTATT